jgi:hypothetical protein
VGDPELKSASASGLRIGARRLDDGTAVACALIRARILSAVRAWRSSLRKCSLLSAEPSTDGVALSAEVMRRYRWVKPRQ